MEDFRLVIITGMSGAGKTQVSRHMEDLGYFCVDNLPPMFIPKFAELCTHSSGSVHKVALVVDTRGREFFDKMIHILDSMDESGMKYEMLFMEASDATIIRRYKESRRRHPMAPNSRISEGIAKERERLARVRARATHIIDTSDMKKSSLKEKIIRWFGNSSESNSMNITVVSFGFKHGMPLDADLMLDVRFLPNPYYIDSMRHKSGAVPEVAEYIWKWPVTKEFVAKLNDLVEFLVPNYIKEGKSQLVIAIGCTGGMHRSVFIANRVYTLLCNKGYGVNIEHRDVFKNEGVEHPQITAVID